VKKRKLPPVRTGTDQRKNRESLRVSFWPGREPFTVPNLRKILEDDVLKGQPMPLDLITMARDLNGIHGAFWFRKTTAPQSQAKQARAKRVRDAIEVLTDFFEERRRAYRSKDRIGSLKIIKNERELRKKFSHFVLAMQAHDFQLDMDIDEGGLMPRLDSWRHVADVIAGVFEIAMFPREFGRSNKGPVARFVAAVVPLMTSERPVVSTVAQHLKRRARDQRFQQGQRGK
jgi:hypothetical protein